MSSLDSQPTARSQRRLAAILSADIVGYSKMVGRDEERTVALVTEQLARMAGPVVTAHQGQIFKTMGDGFLAIFNSSLDAVRCALAFQDSVAKQNADLPEPQRLQYRVGINVGDVIISENDYYGDAVNVAARIQTASEPGGICVSGGVYDQVKNRLSCGYVLLGAEKFKNIADPVVVYRVANTATPASRLNRTALLRAVALAAILIAAGWTAWSNRATLQQFAGSEASTASTGMPVGGASTSAETSPSAAEQRRDIIFKRMRDAMQSDRFGWRTIERLAIEAGVTENEAHEILAAHPKDIVLGKSRDGKLLARLSEH
jgi:class 3 adenylate cyclase